MTNAANPAIPFRALVHISCPGFVKLNCYRPRGFDRSNFGEGLTETLNPMVGSFHFADLSPASSAIH
jgi:hypothetical protein